MLILAVAGVIRLLLPDSTANNFISILGKVFHSKITGGILDYVQAFVHVVIALGWLLILFVAGLENSLTMPPDGEAGILPSFQVVPHIYTVAEALKDPGPTPYLSASLNFGFYLLVLGIAIGGIAVFKKAITTIVGVIILLIILHFVSDSLYHQLLHLIGL